MGNDKISDAELASFAAGGDAAERSVIVEVEVPNAYARARTPAKKLVKRKSAPSEDKYATALAKSMARFEKVLDELGLLADAVRLPAVSAFVLDVRPGELRTLCESPLVAAIRPNRVHKVPRGG